MPRQGCPKQAAISPITMVFRIFIPPASLSRFRRSFFVKRLSQTRIIFFVAHVRVSIQPTIVRFTTSFTSPPLQRQMGELRVTGSSPIRGYAMTRPFTSWQLGSPAAQAARPLDVHPIRLR